MTPSQISYHLRHNGDLVVAFSLLGCLFRSYWTISVLTIFFSLSFLLAFPGIFRESISRYVNGFRSELFVYYNLKIVFSVLLLMLTLIHGDRLSTVETPLKGLFAAFIITLYVDRFRWQVLVYGAAAASIVSFVVGYHQVVFQLFERAQGDTNPIRFGMIALVLGSVCAVGLLHARGDRVLAIVASAGFLSGIAAALLSGSRGAIIALPFVLLLLAPVLWKRSRYAFMAAAIAVFLFVGALLAGNVGQMSSRIWIAYTSVAELVAGDSFGEDRSVGDRTKLMILSLELFRQSPIYGVGSHGWNRATEAMAQADDPNVQIGLAYNQAHNQFADDLAKGGLLRFIGGFAILFLPLYLFNRGEPFSDEKPGSEAALAGIVVSVSFIIFCLTESLMILSLPALIHVVLIFFLLGCFTQARSAE